MLKGVLRITQHIKVPGPDRILGGPWNFFLSETCRCCRSTWNFLSPLLTAGCYRLMAVFLLLGVASPVHSEILGDIFKPFISITEMYDSNIFRAKDRDQLRTQFNTKRMSDFITVLSVGSDIRYQLSGHTLNLSYKRDFNRYIFHHSQNTDSDNAKGDFTLVVIEGLKFRGDGLFYNGAQPRIDYTSAGARDLFRVGQAA